MVLIWCVRRRSSPGRSSSVSFCEATAAANSMTAASRRSTLTGRAANAVANNTVPKKGTAAT